MLSAVAVPLLLATYTLASSPAQLVAQVAAVLPYDAFNAAFQLVEYCVVEHASNWGVSGHHTRDECELKHGSWEIRPGFQPQPEAVYVERVEARTAEVRASGRAAVWVVRVAEDAKYYETRYDDWERIADASMDDMRVHDGRLYLQVHTTAEKMDALVGTGQFDAAMAMPAELLVHPDVIVADQHATEDSPMRSLRIAHAVTLKHKQREAERREEMSRIRDETERERLIARSFDRHEQSCSYFENCRFEKSGTFAQIRSVPRGELHATAIRSVNDDPSITSIHVSPIVKTQNYNATTLIQSGTVGEHALTPLHDAGLHGENIVVGVADDGLDHMSCFFHDPSRPVSFSNGRYASTSHRKIRQYLGSANTATGGHGTHVCGSLAGESSGSESDSNGIAYKAKLAFYDIALSGPYSDLATSLPVDINNEMLATAYDVGARVFSNSWTLTEQNYGPVSTALDIFTHNNQDVLILFSVGNNAGTGIQSPATAKNVLAVGATVNGVESPDLAEYSSRGPSTNGLIRPSVVAPGFATTSANSQASPSTQHCSITESEGTSMATPLVAGTAALLQQYFQEGFYPTGKKRAGDGFRPMGALLHALLVNSGQKMFGPEANKNSQTWDNYGWGMVRADASVFLLGHSDFDLFVDGKFSEQCSTACPRLRQDGPTRHYKFKVRGNSHPLKITLVWHDYYGSNLVNDVDLKVYEGQSTTPLPVNNLAAGQRDNKNNVEQVWIESPTVGATYRVEVIPFSLQREQFFSLAVTGNFYKDKDYFADHIPVVTSSAYANGQVLLFGQRFGSDESLIEAGFACDGTPMASTALAASGDAVVFNITQNCSTITGHLFAQTFYLDSVGSIEWSDASIAKQCKKLDADLCTATTDCVVSGSKCKVSPAASERTGYTGKKDNSEQYGVYEIAIAAIVVFLGLTLVIGGYKVCCKSDPNARNSEDSEDVEPPTATVASASTASNRASLPRGWKVALDGNTGREYYWNVRTNETTWVRPVNSM